MGTQLRDLKQSMKGKKLSDEKIISGKGRLTKTQIDRIQTMYGVAIRAKHNLAKMKENVWAIYFHKLLTDQNPLHNMCTVNCPYQKAKEEGKLHTFKHKNSLPAAVMEAIKPVFKDLTHPDLLQKCLEGYTQNPNESINNLIWKFCPKRKNHGLTTVNTAVALAIGVFNDGSVTYARVMKELGPFAHVCFSNIDADHIRSAQRQAKAATHEARIARRRSRLTRNETQEEEGFPYLAGAY